MEAHEYPAYVAWEVYSFLVNVLNGADNPWVAWAVGHFFIVAFACSTLYVLVRGVTQTWRSIALAGADCCEHVGRFALGVMRLSFFTLIALILAQFTLLIVQFVYTEKMTVFSETLAADTTAHGKDAARAAVGWLEWALRN